MFLYLSEKHVQAWMELIAQFIHGRKNMTADQPSHQGEVIGTGWFHHHLVYKKIWEWDRLMVDLLASQFSEKLSSNTCHFLNPFLGRRMPFNSPVIILTYFHPSSLTHQVLDGGLMFSSLKMILVMLWHPLQEWYSDPLSFLADDPRELPWW